MLKYICALFVLIGICFGGEAKIFPELTGRIVDSAHILSSSTQRRLTDMLQAEPKYQVVVVTVDSLNGQPIEEYGYQLGRHWGIGEKGMDNGVLLLIAPNEGLVRIEVGYGLEGVLTDALSAIIIQQHMMPLLKEKKYDAAAVIGTQGILSTIKGEQFKTASAEEDTGIIDITLMVLIVGLFIYVASAPRENRAARLRSVLYFLSMMRGGRGSGFRGKGGRFGGGGSTGRFK